MGAATSEVVEPRAARPRKRLSTLVQRFGLVPDPPGDDVYHGFISYSHAADGKLARALQRGLQRFAKPWYRTRALHIFRDETALSANPDLWESVKEALDASQHYILLASPRAAASEWVGKEAGYWLEHKSPETILIALTDGELPFNGNTLEPGQNALPLALREAFQEEPRYTDLRWAKESNDLSISHPQFRNAVAEFAAPLHGMPKEAISSEEVRQHRRTVRVARSAAMTLVTLLVVAIVAALIAYTQYQSAQSRSLAAQATADLATDPQQSLSLALQSTQINTSSTGVQALRQALAQAPLRMVIDSRSGDSAHAAWNPVVNQIAVTGPNDTVQLWNPRNGRVERVLQGPGRGTMPLYSQNGPIQYSADGQWIAYVDGKGTVSVWNALTGRPAPTGGLVDAIAAAKTQSKPGTTVAWSGHSEVLLVTGTGLDRVIGFNPRSGAAPTMLKLPGDTQLIAPSPDGSELLLGYGTGNAHAAGSILDPTTGRLVPVSSAALGPLGLSGHEACWLPGGSAFVTWDPTEAGDLFLRFWSASTGRQVSAIPLSTTVSAAACGGTAADPWLATGDYSGHGVLRLSSGLAYGLTGHSQIIHSVAASPSGAFVATASDDGTARVWSTSDGAQVRLLPDGAPVDSIQFSPDSGLVLTTDQRGLVKIWDVGAGEASTVLAAPGPGHTDPLGFVRGGAVAYGLETVPRSGALASAELVTWSSTSGAVLSRVPLPSVTAAANVPCNSAMQAIEFCNLTPPPTLVTHVPTGNRPVDVAVAISADASRIAYAEPGAVAVVDGAGRPVARLHIGSDVTGLAFATDADALLIMSNRAVRIWSPGRPLVQIPQTSPPIDAQLSADGSTVAAAQIGGTVGVWSVATGRALARLRPSEAIKPPSAPPGSGPTPLRVALSPDGSVVAAGTIWQTVSIWSVTGRRLIAVKAVSTPRDSEIGGFGGNGPWPIAELAFSADGSRVVAVDYPQIGAGDFEPPGTATVFDAHTGGLIAGFTSPGQSGAAPVSPGAALSPDGGFLFAGLLGLAPAPSGGNQAIYQVGAQGMLALNLQNAGLAPLASQADDPTPADPWSPDGIHLLAGARDIYACDACGSLVQLQRAARDRAAWLKPLSTAQDRPPSTNPYS